MVLVLFLVSLGIVIADNHEEGDLLPRVMHVIELAEFKSSSSLDKEFFVEKLETFAVLEQELAESDDIGRIKDIHSEIQAEWGECILLVRYTAVESKKAELADFFAFKEDIQEALFYRGRISLARGGDKDRISQSIASFNSKLSEAESMFTSVASIRKGDAGSLNDVFASLEEVEVKLLEAQEIMQEFVLSN